MPEPVVDDKKIAYKVSHAAHLLECSRAHLYNLIARGELKSIKLGAARRITRAEIDRYLAERAAS
jgi:excisionase family DNA binding protein